MNASVQKGFAGIGMIAAVIVGFWAITPADAELEAMVGAALACEAALEPPSVTVGTEAEVTATLSEEVGPVSAVHADDESGLHVSAEQGGTPQVVHLTVDATDAEPGNWSLTFQGEEGECHGMIGVDEDA